MKGRGEIMEIGLFQQQSLKLTMSKELSQAISLLQYSSMDIVAFLHEQALQNPLIDFSELPVYTSHNQKNHATSDSTDYMSSIPAPKETLYEHLMNQSALLKLDECEQAAVEFVIHSLDDAGYLHDELIILANQLGQGQEQVEKALQLVQQMDPAGVGARSLQECLMLQLKRSNQWTEKIEQILTHHFEEFAYKKWMKISKLCQISLEALQHLHEQIKKLNPRPGSFYMKSNERFIVPDFIVKIEDGNVVAYANEDLEPRLSVNEQYKLQLKNRQNQEMFSYLQEKYREFQWIMKSLHTRKDTLNALMNTLLVEQEAFFKKGPSYLKPLTMKEVAEQTSVHESTISRATRHKYIQTPFGTFSMKSFFSTSIQLGNNEATSTTHVKELLKKLVSEENKQRPLSDQQLANVLQSNYNVTISRRTVAKYRDQLNVLPSSQRKLFVTQ